MRGIGEPIWRDRSAVELVECQLHEALINVAFGHAEGFRLLCPYDVGSLGESVVHEARCSHPVVHGHGGPCASAAYRAVGAPPAAEAPLPPPPSRTITRSFDARGFADVRDAVATCGIEAGLDDVQLDGFILAIHELATNSVRHGGGIGVLRAWTEGDVAVCEIRDRGNIRDALAGRRAPRSEQLGGWGLWIANQICDLVQIRSGADGTVVRARLQAT
jgi:anti-sigma regulatory factor (Ser/Thr protein kinase)